MTMPSMPERQSMSLPGGVITFREAGTEHEGEIPLVLLHGININSGIWMHQFAHFADQYHVVAWDAPSYGGSTPRDGDVQEYAGALCEFIDTLDLVHVTESGLGVHAVGKREYWLSYQPEGPVAFTNGTIELETAGWYELEVDDTSIVALYSAYVYELVPTHTIQ